VAGQLDAYLNIHVRPCSFSLGPMVRLKSSCVHATKVPCVRRVLTIPPPPLSSIIFSPYFPTRILQCTIKNRVFPFYFCIFVISEIRGPWRILLILLPIPPCFLTSHSVPWGPRFAFYLSHPPICRCSILRPFATPIPNAMNQKTTISSPPSTPMAATSPVRATSGTHPGQQWPPMKLASHTT